MPAETEGRSAVGRTDSGGFIEQEMNWIVVLVVMILSL